jgi:hypothetical protein
VNLYGIHADTSQFVGEPVGGSFDLVSVRRVRADRRDTNEVVKTGNKAVIVLLSVRESLFHDDPLDFSNCSGARSIRTAVEGLMKDSGFWTVPERRRAFPSIKQQRYGEDDE